MKYELPKIPYQYDALEPHIDAQTMEIHHTKHHQGYTDKMNAVLEKYPNLQEKPLEEIMKNLVNSGMESADQKAFQNNAGGYLNHKLFWEIMGPEKEVDEELTEEIIQTFESIDNFKEQFEEAAKTRFGSGWTWLVRNQDGKLEIYSTANQDSPYLNGHTPLIGLDVWEHAYYLKYQNKRPEYIKNWWKALKIM